MAGLFVSELKTGKSKTERFCHAQVRRTYEVTPGLAQTFAFGKKDGCGVHGQDYMSVAAFFQVLKSQAKEKSQAKKKIRVQ